jgi:hypothetical protein
MSFNPYADETASLEIGGLTLENHTDHIALFGQMAINKDQVGLQFALELQAELAKIVILLQAAELPKNIATAPIIMVRNPFA